MTPYLDTGVWLKIYVAEARAERVVAYLETFTESIPLNNFQELEGRNALFAKRFRGELDDASLSLVLHELSNDFEGGRWYRVPVDWLKIMSLANTLAEQNTHAVGCRTLDVLHVAMAVSQSAASFVTFDNRQAKLAIRVGLRVLRLDTNTG